MDTDIQYRLNLSPVETLTENFYRWEVRGRGWNIWDHPVYLEPPFIPFRIPSNLYRTTKTDDGRKSTFISSLIDNFKSGINSHSTPSQEESVDQNSLPIPFIDHSEIKEFKITFPSNTVIQREYSEHFLLSLSSCSLPVSFEILGAKKEVSIHFACHKPDAIFFHQQLKLFYPEAMITESDAVKQHLNGVDGYSIVVDCGLNDEFMRPIKTFKDFDPEPLTTMYGTLANLQDDDVGLVQILFQAVDAPWAPSIMRSVRNSDGTGFFADAPEMMKLAEKKISKPLFSVVLRLIGKGPDEERAWEVAKNLYSGLSPFTEPLSNDFIPLENEGYEDDYHYQDVIHRRTRRSGMLLNSDELLGFIHLPSSTVITSVLKWGGNKSRETPLIALGHDFILGKNIHQNKETNVSLSVEQRLKHVHIIGKTGVGKSTLLVNMILQDIEAGWGVAVIDPHGDLIERIIERIPEKRLEDVILFDPSDTEYPIGFNILEAHSELEKTVLSSDLVELFRRYSTSWGDQMTTVLANAVIAFVESQEKGTIADLKRFLLEPDFRNNILKQGCDSSIIYFWEKEYPLLKGNAQVSILTRLDTFLRSKLIRNILTQKEGLNFREIVETGKIFLAKLSQGLIGEENANLLGSLICSKLHQVVIGRQSIDTSSRVPFFLYLDEFQHFTTQSMGSILSGSRKYAFGLTLVHQDLIQITDTALANSVISNPSTRICFAVGDNDTLKLKSGFAHFESSDLMNLGVGEAIMRIERNNYDCNLNTFDLPIVEPEIASTRRGKVVTLAREMYGKKVMQIGIQIPTIDKSEEPVILIGSRQTSHGPIKTSREQYISPGKKEEFQPKPKYSLQQVSISSADLVNRKALSQHRYLQALIKKMAEQRGFRAEIEKSLPNGGRVDVSLEFNEKRVAVEICNTTGEVQELYNIEKCIKAGFEIVVSCSIEKKTLEAIKKMVSQKLNKREFDRVRIVTPEELFSFLDQLSLEGSQLEQRINGYRVKVQYHGVSESEKQQRKDAVAHVMVKTLKRFK